MAKFTGTIGNPSVDATGKKITVPFNQPIDIVFYAVGKAPIIKKTTAASKYDFTLDNGKYQVSMYISSLPESFRIRNDLRDGEFFEVKANSPVTAFQDWIEITIEPDKVDDNPIVIRLQEQLEAMQAVLDTFRSETSFVGTGNIVKESVTNLKMDKFVRYLRDEHINSAVEVGNYGVASSAYMTTLNGYPNYPFKGTVLIQCSRWATNVILQEIKQEDVVFRRRFYFNDLSNPVNDVWVESYTSYSTSTDSNGVIHYGIHKPSKNTIVEGNYGIAGFRNVNLEIANSFFPGLTFSGAPSYLQTDFKTAGATVSLGAYSSAYFQFHFGIDKVVKYRKGNSNENSWENYNTFLTDSNTVVDSNGNIKMASPVIQLHHDKIIANSDFDPDNPPKLFKVGVGEYRIENCGKMRSDGWTFNKPLDGKGAYYFMLKWEQLNDNDVLIRIFETEFSKDGFDFGEPKDILANERWVDLHFDDNLEYLKKLEIKQEAEYENFLKEELAKAKEEEERLNAEKEEQDRLNEEMEKEFGKIEA